MRGRKINQVVIEIPNIFTEPKLTHYDSHLKMDQNRSVLIRHVIRITNISMISACRSQLDIRPLITMTIQH